MDSGVKSSLSCHLLPNFSCEWKDCKNKRRNNYVTPTCSILTACSPSLLCLDLSVTCGPGRCWLLHVSRPIRVSLADRKEWSTNTTGFGPEWRSNTWRTERRRERERKLEESVVTILTNARMQIWVYKFYHWWFTKKGFQKGLDKICHSAGWGSAPSSLSSIC